MGKALEVVTGIVTAPGGGGATATVCSGNTFTVRDTKKKVRMLDIWCTKQGQGTVRLTSPFLHDAVVGMGFVAPSGSSILMRGQSMELQSQDTITMTIDGSATAGDIEHGSYLVYYEDLPGISGKFINAAELKRRMIDTYVSQNTLALTTGGCYTGSETINAEEDQLKANTDYAILGCTVGVAAIHAVAWEGPDWGNLKIAMPVIAGEQWHNSFFFKELAEAHNLPLIPVFNSSNKSLTTIEGVVQESGTDLIVSTVMARLK